MDPQGARQAAGAPDDTPRVTPQIAAEAAAWVARLHGPGRTRQVELACLAWQARSAAHRHAFERCTETWMEVPNAARAAGLAAPPEGSLAPKRRRGLLQLALGLVVTVGAGGLGWHLLGDGSVYRTEVGESQTVVLGDGSRMALNTDTQLRVDFTAARRRVEVARGEVVFQVARDTARPFVVGAGGSEVEALGTVFAVRLRGPGADPSEAAGAGLEVTLVEGRVAVRRAAAAGAASSDPAAVSQVVMLPGERLRVAAGQGPGIPPRVDRPRVDQLLAWQRNEAVFDGATLAEAVAEMNRYSRTPVVLVGGLADGGQRVSGQFRTGDNLAFARALAALHGLRVQEQPGRLELSRQP